MVFDSVISPAGEEPGDGGPFIAVQSLSVNDRLVFLGGEGSMLDLRRELVEPPEPTGLSRAAGNGFADQGPVPWAVYTDQSPKGLVLLGAPRAFDSVNFFRHGTKMEKKLGWLESEKTYIQGFLGIWGIFKKGGEGYRKRRWKVGRWCERVVGVMGIGYREFL